MASKILHNDMLLEIFQHLDSVKDLANCELVCSGWRKTIVQGNPWKKLFLKKVGI
jgi:F-box-like